MLHATPALDADARRVLGEIDRMRDGLRHAVQQTPAKQESRVREHLTADAVTASNWIEGFKVATVDAEDIKAGESDVDVSEENRAETAAYQHMMAYIQTLPGVPDFEFSTGQINALHWMLQGHKHSPGKPAGRWRQRPAYVTDARNPGVAAYTAPDADDVPRLMSALVEWLNDGDAEAHPLVRAAMAHLHLVSIHPWMDGNGRMSRSLQTLLIARESVLSPEFSSIEAWLGRPGNTWEYYRQLADRGATYSPEIPAHSWIRFNLTAYHQQAQYVAARLERSAAVWRALAAFCISSGLDERVATALHDVAMTGRVRRTRYETAELISVQQAQRDLRLLVDKNVLDPVGKTRARFYVAGPAFPADALETANTPMTLADPYKSRAAIDQKSRALGSSSPRSTS